MADDRRRDDARPGDPAEGVRIIGAEEAAEAIERGDVAERRGTHLPRYGDRPARPPAGPKPALRFPLDAGADAETPSLRPAKGQRFDPRPPPAWDEPDVADDEGDPWPAESTWGEAAWDDDPQADVVAWTRGETGAQPVVPTPEAPAEPGLTWAEDFVDDDDPWDGSWDEPTGAVRWADDEVETAASASGEVPSVGAPLTEEPTEDVPPGGAAGAPPVDLGAPAPLDLSSGSDDAGDDWAAFGASDDEPRRGRGLFGRRRGRGGADDDTSSTAAASGAGDEAWDADIASAAAAAAGVGADEPGPSEPDTWADPIGDSGSDTWADPTGDGGSADTWAGPTGDTADSTGSPDGVGSDDTWVGPTGGAGTAGDTGDDPDDARADTDDADDGVAAVDGAAGWGGDDGPDEEDDATVIRSRPAGDGEDDAIWAPAEDDAADETEDAAASPWGEPSWGADVVASEPSGETPSAPLFDADGGWASDGDDEKVFDFADEPSGQVALPHWTEPGTGELPRILAGDPGASGTSGSASGSTPAVHWRDHDGAWAGDEDFADLAEGDDLRLGALDVDRPHEEDLYAFDELDEVGGDAAPAAPPPPHDEPGSRRIAPARPVPEADRDGGGGGGGVGRNLGVAVAVGVGVAAVALGALAAGSAVAMIVVVAALVVAMGEYQAAAQRAGYHPASLLGLAAAGLYPIAVYWKGLEAYPLLAVLTIGAALAWHLAGADGDARVVESVGVTLFGVAWIGGLGSFAGLLLSLPDGRGMFVTAVIAGVGYDVGGLFVGRTMGSRPISDASPNKTVEGLVGGMFVSLFVTIVAVGMFGIAPWGDIGAAAKIGLLAMLAAPLGDLCESLVKRDLGVKDMGNLLPEHGGVLDRFDGLLFVLPTVFYAAMLFGLHPF